MSDPTSRSRAHGTNHSRRSSVPSVHPNTLAHSLLLNAEELVASKPRHTPVALTLPDKKIVSSGDVDDVIRQMTKRAPRHGLIVLYTTTAGEIWVQAA